MFFSFIFILSYAQSNTHVLSYIINDIYTLTYNTIIISVCDWKKVLQAIFACSKVDYAKNHSP